jgi:hypothetical protein
VNRLSEDLGMLPPAHLLMKRSRLDSLRRPSRSTHTQLTKLAIEVAPSMRNALRVLVLQIQTHSLSQHTATEVARHSSARPPMCNCRWLRPRNIAKHTASTSYTDSSRDVPVIPISHKAILQTAHSLLVDLYTHRAFVSRTDTMQRRLELSMVLAAVARAAPMPSTGIRL